MSERYDAGMKVRRQVLGDAHVERATAAKTEFDAPFQDMITEGAWGTVWDSDGLTHRERSILTIALLAGAGNFEEVAMSVPPGIKLAATPIIGSESKEVIKFSSF